MTDPLYEDDGDCDSSTMTELRIEAILALLSRFFLSTSPSLYICMHRLARRTGSFRNCISCFNKKYVLFFYLRTLSTTRSTFRFPSASCTCVESRSVEGVTDVISELCYVGNVDL
jgi:hypothetical protein